MADPAPIRRNYRRLMWLGGGKGVGRVVCQRYRWVWHSAVFQAERFDTKSRRTRTAN